MARNGAEIAELARRVAVSECRIVVAGGGDDSEKVLGVLPISTVNYFERNLGIAAGLEKAARSAIRS